jgi:hypothetical protein
VHITRDGLRTSYGTTADQQFGYEIWDLADVGLVAPEIYKAEKPEPNI